MSNQKAVMNISKHIGTGSAPWRRKAPPFTVLASGFTLTSMIDPSDGTESDMPYSVGARGPKDELIVYSASRVLAGFTFESECSDHPSLEREVSAATR